MTYLEIARAALFGCEESEKSPSPPTLEQGEASAGCEKSERSEKSPERDLWCSLPTPDEAEQLKTRIIAAVTVDPAAFDRELYDALMAEWTDYEETIGQHATQGDVA